MNIAFLLVGRKRHARLASFMVSSLRKVMPDAQIIQQTDSVTKAIAGVDRVERLDWNGKQLMTYRLRHLSNLKEPTLVLDVDIVVQRDVSEIEQVEGDIVLTSRHAAKEELADAMPYNTGVMFVRNPTFFSDCWEWCKQASSEVQRWGGDQLAVAAVVKDGKFTVSTIPGRIYNFSPKRRGDKRLEQAAIVHYKGADRKRWMVARSLA